MPERKPNELSRRGLLGKVAGTMGVAAAKTVGGSEVLVVPGRTALPSLADGNNKLGIRNDNPKLVPFLSDLGVHFALFDFGWGNLDKHPHLAELIEATIAAGIEPIPIYNPQRPVSPKRTEEVFTRYFDFVRSLEEKYKTVYSPNQEDGDIVRNAVVCNEANNPDVPYWFPYRNQRDLLSCYLFARQTYDVLVNMSAKSGEKLMMGVGALYDNRNIPLSHHYLNKIWSPIPDNTYEPLHVYGGIVDVLYAGFMSRLYGGIRREIGEINTAEGGGNLSLQFMLNAVIPQVREGVFSRVTFFQLPEFKSYGLVTGEEIDGKQIFVPNSRYPIVRQFGQKLRSLK